MIIAPVIANLGPLESLSIDPNPDEVEDIFTIPLSHACVEHNQGYTHFRIAGRYGYTLPVFLNAKHRVWGLTAIATDAALSLLLPGLYRSKVYLRHTR
nr:PREDICTED: nucleoside diphosphate-linked moiety X motif 8, mitochondrial [Latimeria chalumnae]|eukprot:XP_014352774.1 PREDICTED: nucleoside diphosphate-linked moiety X motif 8, mitochondrial [Latimeria chalumnae]